jgi:hypothetical protein
MKRIVSVIALAAVAMLTLGSAASASKSVYFVGKTSQKFDLLFQDVRSPRGEFVSPFSLDANITCPEGLGGGEAEFTFSGFQIPVVNGKFSFVENDPDTRFHWGGAITGKTSKGTLGIAFPAFADSGKPVSCTSGAVTWKASELVPARQGGAALTPAYRIDIAKNAAGAISVTVTHTS